MNLSSLQVNQIGRFPNSDREFIVTSRTPEDRSSGSTIITFDGGERQDFYWDYEDPEVILLGQGKLLVSIQHQTSAPKSRSEL